MILSNEEILGIIVDIYENHHIGEFGFNIEKLIREMGYNLIPYSSFEDESQIRLLKSFEEDGFSLFNVKTNKCEIYYNDFIKPKTRL